MYIVHDPIESDPLRQEITVGANPVFFERIQPYVFRRGSPGGTFYLAVEDSNNQEVYTASAKTIADLGSGNHWHGFTDFPVKALLTPNTVYYVALKSAGGYSYSGSDYIAWANSHYFKNAFPSTYTGSQLAQNAARGMKVYGYQIVQKGVA